MPLAHDSTQSNSAVTSISVMAWKLGLSNHRLTVACMQIFVTGHSLGGALATLASYDIQQAVQHMPVKVDVACYTFGSPRVGNHAFARDVARDYPCMLEHH